MAGYLPVRVLQRASLDRQVDYYTFNGNHYQKGVLCCISAADRFRLVRIYLRVMTYEEPVVHCRFHCCLGIETRPVGKDISIRSIALPVIELLWLWSVVKCLPAATE